MGVEDLEDLGTWGPSMKKFMEGPQCDEIFSFLRKRISYGRMVFPDRADLFRSFKETPKDELKAVFFLQDPYHSRMGNLIVADGIALSCSNTGKLQPSLEVFYEAIKEHVGDPNIYKSPDLSYLCRQGVLLLNTSLTVEEGRPGCHSAVKVLDSKIRLWEPFMRYFIENVLSEYKHLPLVFCGKESQYYERFVNPLQHYILRVEHPAAAARQERKWNHQKVFRSIDILLKEKNVEINWTLKKQKE